MVVWRGATIYWSYAIPPVALAIFLAQGAQAALPAACLVPSARPHPVVATHVFPLYPAVSVFLGEQGTTYMTISLDRQGVPIKVTLDKSSGSDRLDNAAMAEIKADWRWKLVGVECQTVQVSIAWDLKQIADVVSKYVIYPAPDDYPPDAREKKEEGVTTVLVDISASGQVIRVNLGSSSGYPLLDAKAREIAARHTFKTGQIDGHDTETYLFIAVPWYLQDKPADAPKQ